MSILEATLAGFALELPEKSPHPGPGWNITSGVGHFERTFEVHKNVAVQIMETAGSPIDLFLKSTSNDGRDVTIRRLFAMNTLPGFHPDSRLVVVADQRVYWPNVHVERDYNVRRNTGDNFLRGDNFVAAEIVPLEDFIQSSIFDGNQFTTLEALVDVLDLVTFSGGSRFVLLGSPPERVLDETQLRDPGDAAIARLLREFPGFSVYPHPDGNIRVYDTHGTSTQGLGTLFGGFTIEELGDVTQFHFPGFGSVDAPIVVDRKGERPESIRVHFDSRHEMQLIGNDGAATSLSPDQFRALNVTASPDRILGSVRTRLTPDGSVEAVEVDELSWVEFGNNFSLGLLRAWKDDEINNPVQPPGPDGIGSMSQRAIREHIASSLQFIWDDFASLTATINPIWTARLRKIMADWRWTWAIDPFWWGHIDSFTLRRVAITNRILGRGVQSPVYMDHILRPNRLAEIRGSEGVRGELRHGSIALNLTGDPGNPVAGPFVLVPRNMSAGVFSVRPSRDATGERDMILPGIPEAGIMPVKQLGEFNTNPEVALALWDDIRLAQGFEMQTIVTILPSSPNDETRLHTEVVLPVEAAAVIGSSVGQTRAPPLSIRIPLNLMTADFGLNPNDSISDNFASLSATLENGVRPSESKMVNRNAVRALALAVAAAHYDPLIDRPETSGAEGRLDPEAVPRGGVTEVEHGMGRRGETTTTLRAFGLPRTQSFWRFLDDSTRKVILRSLPSEAGEDLSVT